MYLMEEAEMKKREGLGDSHVSGLLGGAIHKDGA